MKVDAIVKGDWAQPRSYVIASKNPQRAEENLRAKEAAGFVKTALSDKAMPVAAPTASAPKG